MHAASGLTHCQNSEITIHSPPMFSFKVLSMRLVSFSQNLEFVQFHSKLDEPSRSMFAMKRNDWWKPLKPGLLDVPQLPWQRVNRLSALMVCLLDIFWA